MGYSKNHNMADFILKPSINEQKDNVRKISIPFDILTEDERGDERRMVIFLGENFLHLPGTNLQKAYRLINQCLDYVRRECAGYELYYKPHPKIKERDEREFLDLSGFNITGNTVAELFYVKNIKKIKYVFAACSMASRTAYNMGLNSYTFMNIVGASFDPQTLEGFREFNKDMPPDFFINSFSQPLKENRRTIAHSAELERCISSIFTKKNGSVWFQITDPGNLADILAIVAQIRKIDPKRKVNLVIIKHHRWRVIPTNDFREYFDEVVFLLRVFYSLRPGKLFRAIQTARVIKKFPIQSEDIIIDSPGLGFAAACFASYFQKNIKIALMQNDTFRVLSGQRSYGRDLFRTRPGARFFNLILEPLLGIERSIFIEDRRRIFNAGGYLRPINDIFDHIWVY